MTASLAGVRALVTRPAAQCARLAEAIRAAGGVAVEFPLIEIAPLADEDHAERAQLAAVLATLERFDLAVFVSSNAVRILLEELHRSGRSLPATLRCVAVGSATARALREAGVGCLAGATTMDSEELLALPELQDVAGLQVVIFRGVGGREHLAGVLAARGASVTRCALYRRRLPPGEPGALADLLRGERINVVLLSSGEGLANLLALLAEDAAGTILQRIVIVTPGERVAELARAAGLPSVCAAANATDAAMLALLRAVAVSTRKRTPTA